MAKRRTTDNKLNKAFKNHAGDETRESREFIDLPPGINGGRARLSEAKIGTYAKGDNQGKDFVYLQAVVLEPKTVVFVPQTFEDGKIKNLPAQEVTTEGQFTSVMFPLCDTKTRVGKVTEVDEHVDNMENEIRKLGGDTGDVGDLESLADALEELKGEEPVIRFSTSASAPTAEWPIPRTWQNWHGVAEDYEPEETDAVVEPAAEKEPDEDDSDEDDLDKLAKLADPDGDDDADAAKRLTQIANEADIDAEEIETWEEVVELIRTAKNSQEGEDEEDEGRDPSVGEVWKYRGMDYTVLKVYPRKKTADIKNLENEKVVKNVSWAKLT